MFNGNIIEVFSICNNNIACCFAGWTPSTFISSRKAASIADDKNRNKPEHFMDEEVLKLSHVISL